MAAIRVDAGLPLVLGLRHGAADAAPVQEAADVPVAGDTAGDHLFRLLADISCPDRCTPLPSQQTWFYVKNPAALAKRFMLLPFLR